MKRRIFTALLVFFALTGAAHGAVENSTRRFGLFIGSNNGGRNRATLRYAISDARSVSRVFSEMGGINAGDNILLVEPNIGEINRQIKALHNRVLGAKQSHKRTEIVFYYSGHSDDTGLLLNREQYRYGELREQINSIPADMRIVILDSCSSGAFTRAKGGVKTQPFLIDDSISAEGYAFLASSSANEVSQESDLIASSYFTHSLVTGLRGAADTIGDGRVTLNEVYRFAYTETLAKTETSIFGAQHPSYDMQISGTGDVVLTDIKETSAGLLIDENITGRLSIRDSSDHLVAEITKTGLKPVELGLEPGLYRITLQRGDNFSRAELRLSENRRTPLTAADFRVIAAAGAVARGDAAGPETGSAKQKEPEGIGGFNLQLVPGLILAHTASRDSIDHLLLGIVAAHGYGLNGAGLASIGISNAGTTRGVQAAGIYNSNQGDMQGFQGAGIFTILNGNMTGLRMAGIFNVGRGDLEGIQGAGVFNIGRGKTIGVRTAGLFNIANGDQRGVQATGGFNVLNGSVEGVQAAGGFNLVTQNFTGVQVSGFFNYAGGNFRGFQTGLVNYRGGDGGGGFQAGLVNVSRDESVVPIGLVNIVKRGILHPALYYDSMGFLNFSFRSGSKHFYSVLGVGAQKIYLRFNGTDKAVWGWDKDDVLLVYRSGVGFEIPLGPVFLNLDVTAGSILNLDTISDAGYTASASFINQARLAVGFKAFEHLGAFVGISYDYLRLQSDSSPDPRGKPEYVFDWGDSRNINKLGFFAGIQF